MSSSRLKNGGFFRALNASAIFRKDPKETSEYSVSEVTSPGSARNTNSVHPSIVEHERSIGIDEHRERDVTQCRVERGAPTLAHASRVSP